jgi:hypothetical protein
MVTARKVSAGSESTFLVQPNKGSWAMKLCWDVKPCTTNDIGLFSPQVPSAVRWPSSCCPATHVGPWCST